MPGDHLGVVFFSGIFIFLFFVMTARCKGGRVCSLWDGGGWVGGGCTQVSGFVFPSNFLSQILFINDSRCKGGKVCHLLR